MYYSLVNLNSDALAEVFTSDRALKINNFETATPRTDPKQVEENHVFNSQYRLDKDLWQEVDVRQLRDSDKYLRNF